MPFAIGKCSQSGKGREYRNDRKLVQVVHVVVDITLKIIKAID